MLLSKCEFYPRFVGLLMQCSTYKGVQSAAGWNKWWADLRRALIMASHNCGIAFQSWDPCSPGFHFLPFLWLQCWFSKGNFIPNTSITTGLKLSSFRPTILSWKLLDLSMFLYLCVYWYMSKVIFKSGDFCPNSETCLWLRVLCCVSAASWIYEISREPTLWALHMSEIGHSLHPAPSRDKHFFLLPHPQLQKPQSHIMWGWTQTGQSWLGCREQHEHKWTINRSLWGCFTSATS